MWIVLSRLATAMHIERRTREDFPEGWMDFLKEGFPGYEKLSPLQKARLHAHILRLIAAVEIEGLEELGVNPKNKARVLLAAAVVFQGIPEKKWKHLKKIIVGIGQSPDAVAPHTLMLGWDPEAQRPEGIQPALRKLCGKT